MLTGLSVRNVVLIEQLNLEFDGGLSALTGETGAGKSIILDSLGMATGARSDRGLIRSGADRAESIAAFTLASSHPVYALLEQNDIESLEGEDLTLRRVIRADGRSKAYINDAPVSVKLLAEVGSILLEVHGQHDGRGLLDPLNHITMLDLFGSYQAELDAVASVYTEHKAAEKALQSLLALQAKAGDEQDFLEHAIAELDRLDAQQGEDVTLAEERRFLQGAEGALAELAAAQDALGEDGAFEERLSMALAGIERLNSKFGESELPAAKSLELAGQALERALLETQEARNAVTEAAENFDVEPGRLDAVEKRLFALRAAARKYGCDLSGLIDVRAKFAADLSAIESVTHDIGKTRKRAEAAKLAYDKAARALTQARKDAAKILDQAVLTELPPLKMERAIFETHFEEAVETAQGRDSVRFRVSTNPGTALGPLDKIASGGEMARFALAIKVALAGKNEAVMVFDEVDQGVGGAVANAVGKRLSKLAQNAQVFVVTHSPQVAAAADHQFRIEKSSTGTTTTTHVQAVADEAREEEIARMLAGETITQEARAAARQLMSS
ncbi:DNA replication and repair protein RecN [Litorimonas taeanensis]|uniref:DNA repair protein RecN n=1 Tax=Litorimonas taeanensis TaxID=568099 RepID=A0A420WL15_9PROT|nr:DNA repair protein RecN [Litorimonas taeanensis]RKQ71704.1 DNA replication and repair protein RecN [Litorimonas taeanensis]